MSGFFGIRLARHLKKMMKYMRYVFNDHFILVCVFLLGGLGFYYSQVLKTLPANFVWGRPIILIFWLALLQIGRIATLAEEADKVFILPKEPEMNRYLNRAIRYSFWIPLVALFLLGGMSMPLVVVSTGWAFSTFFYFIVMLGILKASHLRLQKYELYQISSREYYLWFLLWFITSLVAIVLSLYVVPIAGPLIALVQVVFFYILLNKKEQTVSLDWERMIQKEKNRMHRIYQFIHLFTDVPEISSSVKRRKFLDPLLGKIKKTSQNTYLYLYARSFLRGSEYSGLFIRLVLVAGVILFFLKEFWISMGVSVLFVYLIGFQLIPIYTQFDYMVMTHLYPVPDGQKKQAVSKLVTVLLLVAALLFSVFVLIALPDLKGGLMVVVALIVEVLLFAKFYVPYRLKKMEG
ncbi:multidrug ABC transporter permease [Enterococcus plantarum]|uniref:Multidrug ABC transporter permease n=1 Tax=Enterococcus plantarum TaxID=1077675 RepID=A0A2W4BGT4_9ENTE|nr:ABC transporter permease [Enterococcus plantarum]PZL72462.1 multidrug ABC transporter permease [Enterococcus plantarum]